MKLTKEDIQKYALPKEKVKLKEATGGRPLFVLLWEEEYEGAYVRGVFTSLGKAKQAIKRLRAKEERPEWSGHYAVYKMAENQTTPEALSDTVWEDSIPRP